MRMWIFATWAMKMDVPKWDSFRVQSAPDLVFLKTKKKARTASFSPDDMTGVKVFEAVLGKLRANTIFS